MATLRPDSKLCEYSFSEEELLQARILQPLQVMYLNTKLALYFKEKASMLIPESSLDDRSYLLKIGNIQGKIDMLEELIDDCIVAQKEAARPRDPKSETQEQGNPVREIAVLSERASAQVHEVQT